VLTEIKPDVFQKVWFDWVYKQQELHIDIDNSHPTPVRFERWVTVKHTIQEQDCNAIPLFI
jgi:hypothetical protein